MVSVSKRVALNPDEILKNVPYSNLFKEIQQQYITEQHQLEKKGKALYQLENARFGRIAKIVHEAV